MNSETNKDENQKSEIQHGVNGTDLVKRLFFV